jgi:hypothetical protein
MDGGTRTRIARVDPVIFGWIGGCSVLVVETVVPVAGEIHDRRETVRQRKIGRVVRQQLETTPKIIAVYSSPNSKVATWPTLLR